jgi:hypothetical protein
VTVGAPIDAPTAPPANGATNPSNAQHGNTTAEPDPTHATDAQTNAAPSLTGTGSRFHDFLDTRLTWTFGDDDILAPTGLRVPISPLPSIGDRPQYQLFFDALNSRFAGRENLTHLVMYSRAPGFIPRIVTEGSLVIRFDLAQLQTGSGNLNQAVYDAGTFLRMQYQTNLDRPNDGLSLTFFPFDTDRFRLGYLWDLSWGGDDVFPRRVGAAPGLRVGFDSGGFSAFAGFKTAYIVVPLSVTTASMDIEEVRTQETQYAGLGGIGYRVNDWFRFDINGGFFQQGAFDFPGVRGQGVYLYGASARVVLNHGMAPSQSIDMMLYRNDPNVPFQIFAPETYTPGVLSWFVSAEGTALAQHLANIEQPGATTEQPAFAGAVQGRVKYGYLGLGLTGLYRDVPFLLRNVPSFIPFQSIPTDAHVSPEFFFAGQVDYRFNAANLLPSLIVGVQLPATFSANVTEGTLQSERTLVIRRAGNFSILPPGAGAVPILSARASIRWDLSSIFAFIGWLQYVNDQNATLLQVDPTGTRQVRVFQQASQFGFGLTAQARF